MTQRKGMDVVMRIIIAGVVFLIIGLVVISAARGNVVGLDLFTKDNQHSTDINLCDSKIESFCELSDNSGKSWEGRYPECQQHKEALQSSEFIEGTSCA